MVSQRFSAYQAGEAVRLRPSLVVLFAFALVACDRSDPQSASLMPVAPTTVLQPAPAEPGIRGSVFDTALRPIFGAVVEILDGAHAGVSTTTKIASGGSFVLPGTFDDTIRFRASKEGHAAAIKTSNPPTCPTCARSVSFILQLDVPPVDLSGDYAVTFAADPACTVLPESTRTRNYAATIVRSTAASRFNVSLLDPSVLHGYDWEGIEINVAGDVITVGLGNLHGSPGLVERVADDTYISFDGGATASVGRPPASTVATSFEGLIEACKLSAGSASVVATGKYVCPAAARVQCFSGKHTLTMTRR
jgi:hypothetical protein